MSHDNRTVLVFGNLNFSDINESYIKVPHYTDKLMSIPIKINSIPVFENNKFHAKFKPGEIQVLLVEDFDVAK